MNTGFLGLAVATVLTVYGIETFLALIGHHDECLVATVLTVYGIETFWCWIICACWYSDSCNSTYRLRY